MIMSKKLKLIIVAGILTLLVVIATRNTPTDFHDTISTNTSLAHDMQKNCTDCHPRQKPDEPFSTEVESAKIHRICYRCHQDYSNFKGWVHGPVALGRCLACHNFHYDENKTFLKYPLPELCYQCHDSQDMDSIERHCEPAYSNCNNCHIPHAGPQFNRLKQKDI